MNCPPTSKSFIREQPGDIIEVDVLYKHKVIYYIYKLFSCFFVFAQPTAHLAFFLFNFNSIIAFSRLNKIYQCVVKRAVVCIFLKLLNYMDAIKEI